MQIWFFQIPVKVISDDNLTSVERFQSSEYISQSDQFLSRVFGRRFVCLFFKFFSSTIQM